MEFYMPVKTFFGTDVLWQHRHLLSALGSKALIVTGKHSAKRSGALDAVLKALEDLGTAHVLFDDIEENPSVTTVLKASALCRASEADFVIGIGGGSPLDAAKAIAVCALYPELGEENLFSQPPLRALPVAAVPTTSGTGSEVTQYAILTDHLDQTKKNLGQSVFPKLAFLDPTFTHSLSLEVTRNTAVDAFTHLAEGFLNNNATAVSDGLAVRGLRVFGRCLRPLEQGQLSDGLRADLMLASMLAGMVIAQTGTSLPHGMGYALTYHHGYAHGLANGVLFAAYLESFKDKQKVMELVSALGLSTLKDLTDLLRRWNVPKERPSEVQLAAYAKQMAENHGKLKNHPEAIDEAGLLEIYKNSF